MRIVPEKHPELEAETSLDDDVAHPEDREKRADRARMFVKNKDVKYVKCKSVFGLFVDSYGTRATIEAVQVPFLS